jgi:chemotaxis protein CheC
VDFVTRNEAAARLSSEVGRRIGAVEQSFGGGFDTEAILMFPEEKSLELVRVMVGTTVPLEQLGEMEQEAMSEIGNIILKSVIGTIADLFSTAFEGSLPLVQTGTSDEIAAARRRARRDAGAGAGERRLRGGQP